MCGWWTATLGWEHEILRGNPDWKDFNKEARVSFVQYLYASDIVIQEGTPFSQPGDFFDANVEAIEGTVVLNEQDQTLERLLRSRQFVGSSVCGCLHDGGGTARSRRARHLRAENATGG